MKGGTHFTCQHKHFTHHIVGAGVRAAMQESDRVAEKGRKRKRILEAVREVGQAKAQEQGSSR